jgi:RNA polymerase sigma factor (sigma-70 family)
MTDSEIIEHLRNDQYSRAVKGLYSIFPAVKKHIVNNSGTTEDAKDVFQDALVILYQKMKTGKFVLHVSISTYLQAVVKNLWLQELRKRKKLPIADTDTDVAEDLIGREDGYDLATAAFNFLGEKCKQLLMLFYFKQKSFREIADLLQFGSEQTAKNQKYRCIQKAKENYLTLSKTDTHE